MQASSSPAVAGIGRRWRLLVHPAGPAAWNLAVDLALLHGQQQGSPPTLRLYRWQQPTISLGAGQRVPPELVSRWRAHGLAVVRRPTGGRAVLHGYDLTYSVTAGVAAGFPPDPSGVYREITAALQRGLARLGLPVTPAPRLLQNRRPRVLNCFACLTPGDLLCQGRKLCGSAQIWQEMAFLQHGSLLLTPPPKELLELLEPRPTADQPLSVSLAELLPVPPPWPKLVAALTAGFRLRFAATFVGGELSLAEKNFLAVFNERQLLL